MDHTTPANQLSPLPPEGLIALTGPLPNYDSEENVLSLLYSEKPERKLQLFFRSQHPDDGCNTDSENWIHPNIGSCVEIKQKHLFFFFLIGVVLNIPL